ncbi:hypothetical protein FOS14_10055 [Skermania sp. ID1734]|uniref:hypothetical protein n=1 Tax=Skermania sp. ID1734 TaxID=2597516 RepID=UPI00117E1524|nr:hypothetical protein [Skermania sp. ID1734]TSE00140.1 hypothetical protein FOS14_10055 [Skermania sp. ID1734]
MHRWLEEEIIAHGRLPLLFFLFGFIAGFLCIRLSVRLIRANVRWWPKNVTAGGFHVHHVVFGMVMMLVSGVAIITIYEDGTQTSGAWLAAFFGAGAALVLDEFALILYLDDVYWKEEGRSSVDAVFVAVAVTALLLLGMRPLELMDITSFRHDPNPWWRLMIVILTVINLALAAIVIVKGKIWTGLLGLFVLPFLIIGAIRLSRPGAPWARWRYSKKPRKMARAMARERRIRRPLIRAKIFVQDLIAGKPSVTHARESAEAELARVVHPAPPPTASAERARGSRAEVAQTGTA